MPYAQYQYDFTAQDLQFKSNRIGDVQFLDTMNGSNKMPARPYIHKLKQVKQIAKPAPFLMPVLSNKN